MEMRAEYKQKLSDILLKIQKKQAHYERVVREKEE